MRKPWVNLACFFLFLMAIPTLLIAQQSGQITLTGNVTSGSGSSVQIRLINCGQYNPRVLYNGSLLSVVVPQTYTATPDANGKWSVTVWSNDLLVCGGTTGATAYQVTYTLNGSPVSTPENFHVTSTGPNPYDTTTQPPLDTLPPAYALKTNFNFQSLTLGNTLNAQIGSFGSINTKNLLINGIPIAAQGQAVPNTGGTVTGTLNQNLSNYFNPQFTQGGQQGLLGNARSYLWSGTLPGTAKYNYGQYQFFLNNNVLIKDTPGCAGFADNCYNTESSISSNREELNSQGGTNVQTLNADHWGLGDTIGSYTYIDSFGGQSDGGGPEGMEMYSGGVTEPSNTYTGTIVTGVQGQTTLTLNCTNDCGSSPYGFSSSPPGNGTPASVGQGLYVMDEQSATASGQIMSLQNGSGETPGTVTVNVKTGLSNLAVSTCYGTLDSDLKPTPDPAGSGTQSVTFTITLMSGTCVAGEIASFAGTMHDQALITAVGTPSSGTQQITADIRQHHEAGSYMFENPNSDAGLYMDIATDNVSDIQFPVDILGVKSISGSTAVMWYRWFYAGYTPGNDNLPAGNLNLTSVPIKNLTNTGGTVSYQLNQGGQYSYGPPFNNENIYISGASNSAFDGECTRNVANLIANANTCTQSGSSGQTATSATITLTDASGTNAYGNSDATFYQGAMIVNAEDTNAPITVNGQTMYPADGKQFEVEANEMPLAIGDLIVEGHSDAMASHIGNWHNTTLNPMAYVSQGISVDLTGVSQSGGASEGGNDAGIGLVNSSPATNYSYFGGQQLAPVPIFITGQWHGLAFLKQAPDPYSNLIDVNGCPASPSSCNDAGYWYGLYSLDGNNGGSNAEFYPDTGVLQYNGPRQFNGFGNDATLMTNVGNDTYAIGFGGRTGAATQFSPLWTDAPANGDIPEIARCGPNSGECGLEDSGTPFSNIARLNSPSFTGTPTAPTASPGTNTTQVATTSFVQSTVNNASPTPVTLSLGTSAIAANSCSAAQTVTVTGATTSMVAIFSGRGVLASSVSGYGASGLKIDASVTTANTVSVQVCNPTTASITPGALTLNVTAIR